MASRIIALLADPQLARKMGIRGHEKVLANYDPRVAARRFERLYMEVAQTAAQ
jgi:glycosyltransferase involved in cell wall biosynthesis